MSTIDQNNGNGKPASASGEGRGEEIGERAATAKPNDAGEVLRILEQNARSIVRMTGALMTLSERSDAIERRLGALESGVADDEPAPSTERRRRGSSPRLALRHDASILLEVTSDLSEDDLEGREVGRYVTLTQAEASDVVDRSDGGFSEAAARAAWQVARKTKGGQRDE